MVLSVLELEFVLQSNQGEDEEQTPSNQDLDNANFDWPFVANVMICMVAVQCFGALGDHDNTEYNYHSQDAYQGPSNAAIERRMAVDITVM
jgi:hypothetical protein